MLVLVKQYDVVPHPFFWPISGKSLLWEPCAIV